MRGFTVVSTIVLVIVVVVVVVAAALLARTVRAAQKINTKAQNIAKNGTGINTSTDSVIQLKRTNNLARSILTSATPLQGQLSGIVTTAQGINGLAGSINSTAGTINSTAGTINTTAGAINSTAGAINSQAGAINSAATSINTSANSINGSAGAINSSAGAIDSTAGAINRSAGNINGSVRSIRTSARRVNTDVASILPTAQLIDTDVRLINQNLDVSLDLVSRVKFDTASIISQAVGANDTAACIAFKLFATDPAANSECGNAPTPGVSISRSTNSGRSVVLSDRPQEKGSSVSDSTPTPDDAAKRSQAPELNIPGLPPLPAANPSGAAESPAGSTEKPGGSTEKPAGSTEKPAGPAQSPDPGQSPPASTGSPPKTGIEKVDELLSRLPADLLKLVPGFSGETK